jgi:type I restriction enzyme R subunit
MIVTTIQKLQGLIRKYNEPSCNEKKKEKVKSKHIAFVVDECHRTVTKQTQVIINGFFLHCLWYGFTGTPIFEENQGALGSTTEQMYGKPLHCYTIKTRCTTKLCSGSRLSILAMKGWRTMETVMN